MMVTIIEPKIEEKTQLGDSGRDRKCSGCPRCKDPDPGICPTYHPETPGVHPVCKWCGHCVLRGSHIDDAEDVKSGRYSKRNDYLN